MTTPGLGEAREQLTRISKSHIATFRVGDTRHHTDMDPSLPVPRSLLLLTLAELARLEEEVERWKGLADEALAEWVAWKDRCEHQAARISVTGGEGT